MTFKEIQDDTLERTTFDSSGGDTSSRRRIKRFINEIYRRVARATSVGRITTATATITTIGNTAEYTITAAQVRSIYNATAGIYLVPITLQEIRILDPSKTTTGEPEYFAVTKNGATTVTVYLYPTPVEAETLDVDTGGALTALSADADVPVIPIDFHYLLGTGARMLEAEKMQQYKSYQITEAEFRRGLGDLRLSLARGRRAISPPKGRRNAFNATSGGNWVDWGL